MNTDVKNAIIEKLDEISKKEYPAIYKKIQFNAGKELVVNSIYTKLSTFPNWSFENALSDVEINLNGLGNE